MQNAARDWGDWVLGDLSDSLRRATEVLGRAIQARSVTIEPPRTVEELPRVLVYVGSEREITRLRRSITQGDTR